MGDVARGAAVEDEHAQALVAGQPHPPLKPGIAVCDISAGDVGANHLADLFLE
ncbi:MAG: hypothetical protein WAU81_06675 [Candidatus Aminicenantales bacterium]